MTKIKNVAPSEIESQSFAIIEREFHDQTGLIGSEIDSGPLPGDQKGNPCYRRF